jgi:hypothetical protein
MTRYSYCMQALKQFFFFCDQCSKHGKQLKHLRKKDLLESNN